MSSNKTCVPLEQSPHPQTRFARANPLNLSAATSSDYCDYHVAPGHPESQDRTLQPTTRSSSILLHRALTLRSSSCDYYWLHSRPWPPTSHTCPFDTQSTHQNPESQLRVMAHETQLLHTWIPHLYYRAMTHDTSISDFVSRRQA